MGPANVDMSAVERRDDERYQRLMATTRDAARQGYEAVSMRDIARSTRMSMTTIYGYCSSKDHLIAEAHLELIDRLGRNLVHAPPRGRSAQARLLRYMDDVIDAWQRDEVLMRTLQRALYSLEPGVSTVRKALHESSAVITDVLIGGDDVASRDVALEIIGHVLDSVTYRWVSGTVDLDEARQIMRRTIRRVVPK